MSSIREEVWNFIYQYRCPTFLHEVPERLKCILCKEYLKRAMQTSCGCKACYKCINEYLGSESKPCPSGHPDCEGTKLEFNNDVHPDNATSKEITKLEIKCPNKECPEEACLRLIAIHLKDCEYREIECEKCKEMYVLYYKTEHDNKDCSERNVTCKWCSKTMIFRLFDKKHLNLNEEEELCQKFFQICPNKCAESGDKPVSIKKHLLVCKNKKVECPYECGAASMTRSKLQFHLNNLESVYISHKLNDAKTSINPYQVIFRGANYIWKIDNYSMKRYNAEFGSINNASITSDPFWTSEFGYKMCLRVYPAGDGVGRNTHLSVFFAIMKGDYDDLLSWPFKQKVTLSLLEHDGHSSPHSVIMDPLHNSESVDNLKMCSACYYKPTYNFNIATGSAKFIQLSLLNDPSNFCKNDTIYVKIAVDLVDISRP